MQDAGETGFVRRRGNITRIKDNNGGRRLQLSAEELVIPSVHDSDNQPQTKKTRIRAGNHLTLEPLAYQHPM